MSINQKEGVYNAVKSIKSFDDGDEVVLTKDEKANVAEIVSAGFESGDVDMSDKARAKYIGNPAALKSYVGGLVNNWMRKDTRLNGGDKYVAKNPGSRAGSGDSVIKNLKLLRSTMSDDDKIAEIDAAIDRRKEEIAAEKAKDIEIDMSLISAELREKLGL